MGKANQAASKLILNLLKPNSRFSGPRESLQFDHQDKNLLVLDLDEISELNYLRYPQPDIHIGRTIRRVSPKNDSIRRFIDLLATSNTIPALEDMNGLSWVDNSNKMKVIRDPSYSRFKNICARVGVKTVIEKVYMFNKNTSEFQTLTVKRSEHKFDDQNIL